MVKLGFIIMNQNQKDFHRNGVIWKAEKSDRKIMVTVFWDAGGVLFADFLPRREPVNAETYIETLKRLRTRICWVTPNLEISSSTTGHTWTSEQGRQSAFLSRQLCRILPTYLTKHPQISILVLWKGHWGAHVIVVMKRWKLL